MTFHDFIIINFFLKVKFLKVKKNFLKKCYSNNEVEAMIRQASLFD